MSAWKQAVARAFDRAEEYDGAARIQAHAADRLAAAVSRHPLPVGPRILEIGCGTGLFTQALLARIPSRSMLVTDLTPGMVARCRTRLQDEPNLRFAVMDAERPCLAPGFDLIAGNLAAQWFEDLPGSLMGLAGLLAPGGLLAVTTLTSETFREWRAAHAAHGLTPATPSYPEAAMLRNLRIPGCEGDIGIETLSESHRDGLAFLKALKAIGAGTPSAPAGTLSAGALRQVLRSFESGDARATYAVATCLFVRNSGPGRDLS